MKRKHLMVPILLLGLTPLLAEAQEKPNQAFEGRLERIVLPPQPTREQSAAYLGELRDLAKLFGLSAASTDREIFLIAEKLQKTFPAEHFDLLASESVNTTRLLRAADIALKRLDLEPSVLKKGILSNLERDPRLIRVVLANGWSKDARPAIVRAVNADGELPTLDWFVAAVELKDPKLYQRLHERTIRSPYAVDYIIALQALPDYDLSNTINEVYRRNNDNRLKLESYSAAMSYYPRTRLRVYAAEYGNVDALGELIKDLKSDGMQFSASTDNFYDSSRLAVIKLINFRGDNSEIQVWFEANSNKLAFDGFRRRYVVQADEEVGE